MNLYFPKITLYFITPLILAMVFLMLFSLPAHASIEIVGDREFTDDVNDCLNTYRNAPGIVGDAIRELENSDNVHRVENSPDWTNAPNDAAGAIGGSGSGTVTKVDKAELEKYKKDFPELANKDFCTALLHEMWHAIDADRGTWTRSTDKIDGVKRNEVEATIFQNLIHAIRGVAPRTAYGGRDISHIVLVGDDAPIISVIEYGDYFIPVDQLRVVTATECDEDPHWHPIKSTVINTKGMEMSDPNPTSCGFGKTASTPVISIEDPAEE